MIKSDIENYHTVSIRQSSSCLPQFKRHCHHWRRQLWGTGARAPPRLPASHFGDPQSTTRKNFNRTNTENVQKQRDFAQFLSIFGPFLSFLYVHSFPLGVLIVPKMPERSPINFNSMRTSDSGKTGS